MPCHRSKTWILFLLKMTTVIMIFVNIPMTQLHYFFVGSKGTALLNFTTFSSLLECKWNDNFLPLMENKVNLKICLYCKSMVVLQSMEHLQSIFSYFGIIKPLLSVPKVLNKFCDATALLSHHLLLKVNQERKQVLEELNKNF